MASTTTIPRLLKVSDLVALTGIDRWRWYALFAKGKGPPHLRIGKTIRVPENRLVAWIEEQSNTHTGSRQ